MLQILDVSIDPMKRRVEVRGEPVRLTPLEFRLLYLLASRPGVVFDRATLIAEVWGPEIHVTARAVDTVVKRLRRKIEADPAAPRMVLTRWGAGYAFADVPGSI